MSRTYSFSLAEDLNQDKLPTVLRFREWIGGEEKINEYCHDLALKGGKRLAEILGTRLLDSTGEFTLNMVGCCPLLSMDIGG
jgi:hypothetical protein